MKKLFRTLAIVFVLVAMSIGIAAFAGCSGGYNGEYVGKYTYSKYGQPYGIKVRVTVENNIITKVVDITKVDEESKDWHVVSAANPDYGWEQSAVDNWTNNEAWLLQKYEGLAVADVLEMQVFIKNDGEPYEKDKNGAGLGELMISGATQGSARVLLAVKNAFGKTVDIGRIETPAQD